MMIKVIRTTIHLGGILPLLWFIYAVNADVEQAFGSDPIKEIIHFFGYTSLLFFIGLFIFRIVNQIFRNTAWLAYHRTFGLWGIFWLSLHILAYLLLELGADFNLFWREIVDRLYLQIGAIAALFFILIAVSSIPVIKKSMKKQWFNLHQAATFAVILAAIHYYLSLKGYSLDAIFFLALCAVLLLWKFTHKKILAWCYR